jgi:DNA-binding CsgD family transcriptional regulator
MQGRITARRPRTSLAGEKRERAIRGRKDSHSDRDAKRTFPVHPKTFVFFDKTSRIQRFEVKALVDGSMPVQEAASLLAMQCVLHGQMPKDFGVMVGAGEDLLNGLGALAKKLIDASVAIHTTIHLTRRQHEVLRAVLQGRTNKEIAEQLLIGVRTVKFHVSALLARFGVADRMSLAQKTSEMLSAGELSAKLTYLPAAAQKAAGAPKAENSRESLLPVNGLDRRSRG